jgi:transglutaminase-like putative cysteine protease
MASMSRFTCVWVAAIALSLQSAAAQGGANRTPKERTFEFTYRARIGALPARAREVRIWVPYPLDDAHQEILRAHVEAPYPVQVRRDSEYGNAVLYLTAANPGPGTIDIAMRFVVRRREHVKKHFGRTAAASVAARPDLQRWLASDRLVPNDGRIHDLAEEITRGQRTPLARARAIYDFVVKTMRYDKSGTGWGHGDIYFACDYKRGNCTDFHALFIGLARAAGIPSRFEIGFPLPPDRTEGEIAGYHCWARFYLDGYGWIPVDTSEASRNPAKRDYFFGAHDPHRVQFAVGRDIVLAPAQTGPPLNYFIYPYVEVDGSPFPAVVPTFAFKDVAAGAAPAP